MAIRFAVSSSNWSDPATWDNGALPLSTDDVYANGFTVVLDTDVTVNTLRNSTNPVYVPDIATPTMTSATTPSGIVNATGNTAGNFPWYAFDQTGNQWQVSTLPAFISYQFPTSKIIKQYAFQTTTADLPKSWTFDASNDGVNWTTLDTRTNVITTGPVWYAYVLSNSTAYTYYRMNFTANVAGTNFIRIVELNMTESTGSVFGGSSDGSFNMNTNGVTINCTNGLINHSSTTQVITFNCTAGQTATLNSSPISLAGSVIGRKTILINANGTFNLNANLAVTGNNLNGSFYVVQVLSPATINYTGSISNTYTAAANGFYSPAIWMQAAATLNISASGGVIGSADRSNGVYCVTSGGSTINITGSLGQNAIFINSGITTNVNVNGNVTGTTVPSITNGAGGNIVVNGNVTAGASSAAISLTSTGNTTINGNVIATSAANGISSTSTNLITVTGNLINNSNGTMAVYAQRINISSGSSQTWSMFRSGGIARDLLTSDQITVTGSFPSSSDVRSGVTYALTQTGSCIIPSASAVALGVPVDNTIGTAFLSITDIANAVWNVPVSNLSTTTGSMGALLSRASTVQTTAAQIAALTS